ncbi:helix-turn-helix domain-containing protein [Mariprofundus sp. EBB-1]|uniref:helix-turn-helix transcriptional regulator n=1 Tax=Mariprofundus sp. EBB-1 TaxID=2650971 RepID=UPI000EF1E9CB|nr:helix-turn-helix domain-containing protein [Mariprofundus sp. EBB-1]RLL52224.1 helix-turn-helix domain-containing protein [Mariprofundus sp. EBB-1]
MFSDDIIDVCKQIGMSLQSLRVNRLNETQEVMADRVGVSRTTYIRMEKGDPSVKIGYWLEAAKITRTTEQWHKLFSIESSLFEQFDQQKKSRKRVRRSS